MKLSPLVWLVTRRLQTLGCSIALIATLAAAACPERSSTAPKTSPRVYAITVVPAYKTRSMIPPDDTVCLGDSLVYKATFFDSAGHVIPSSAFPSTDTLHWSSFESTSRGSLSLIPGAPQALFVAETTDITAPQRGPVFGPYGILATLSSAPGVQGRAYVWVRACGITGTWTGTWSGVSWGEPRPPSGSWPSSPVSGTWVLDLQGVDLASQTASGTLAWAGADAYWTYTFDTAGTITSATPHSYAVSRTLQLDASNTSVILETCPRIFRLVFQGFRPSPPFPPDTTYGPQLITTLNPNFTLIGIVPDSVRYKTGGFITHPFGPLPGTMSGTGFSTGNLSGQENTMYSDRPGFGDHLVGACDRLP
jgi:hypothetical protein